MHRRTVGPERQPLGAVQPRTRFPGLPSVPAGPAVDVPARLSLLPWFSLRTITPKYRTSERPVRRSVPPLRDMAPAPSRVTFRPTTLRFAVGLRRLLRRIGAFLRRALRFDRTSRLCRGTHPAGSGIKAFTVRPAPRVFSLPVTARFAGTVYPAGEQRQPVSDISDVLKPAVSFTWADPTLH